MHRLYSLSKNITGDKIIVSDKSELHHIQNVLRLKAGEGVVVFDEKGNEYSANIVEFQDKKLVLKVKTRHRPVAIDRPKITIACAIPKKAKFDDIVDKLTQLGVDKIIPLETERVVVRLNKNKQASRLERWKKIALSAAQQSQRNSIPDVSPVIELEDLIAKAKDYDLKLIPVLIGDGRRGLKDIFGQYSPKNILVLIGPEGDFTPKELDSAKKSGFTPVTLGGSVLRVETAAIAVAAFISFHV